MDNQPTIIDIEYAAKLMGGNRALVKEVLIDFINKIPNYLNELNQYVKDQNYNDLITAIHTIGGGASYAGAKQIREIAKDIELRYKEHDYFSEDHYQKFLTSLELVQQYDVNSL